MEVLKQKSIQELIIKALRHALTYQEYLEMIERYVNAEATSGRDQSEGLINYTKLNHRRMKRWDKTVKISDEVRKVFKNTNHSLTWLVLTESWCGDAAHVIPILNKLAELSDNIDLRLIYRDENPILMSHFLYNGTHSIPKVIMFDNNTQEVVGEYGPRPNVLNQMVTDFKREHGRLSAEFKENLQRWYNKDKGQTIINELTSFLKTL
ncbi:thioredoxin family protein [Urechidicola sp. KH5]